MYLKSSPPFGCQALLKVNSQKMQFTFTSSHFFTHSNVMFEQLAIRSPFLKVITIAEIFEVLVLSLVENGKDEVFLLTNMIYYFWSCDVRTNRIRCHCCQKNGYIANYISDLK